MRYATSLLTLSISAILASACNGDAPPPGTSNNNAAMPSTSAEPPAVTGVLAAGDWPNINRDPGATRFSPLSQIHAGNVTNLGEAWRFQLGGNSTAVPIVIAGIMYVPSRDSVVALDADTGTEIWRHTLPEGVTASTRGVSWWPGDAEHSPRILLMAGRNQLLALDAASGLPSNGFGTDGAVDTGVGFGGVPTIYQNVAIIGAASQETPQGPAGNPRAYDVITGAKLWEFQTVPLAGQPFNDTWGDGWEGCGGTNMWGFMAPVDTASGTAFLPIAGPAPNYYGGGRPGTNLFGNSIVAVDAMTGTYRWHFQTVHHDLWDIDLPSAGALIDIERDGVSTPTIAHVGKSSYVYVLNRDNGEPFHPVEERPVPAGDVPGEWYSPTQPFPVVTPPLSRVSFSAADLVTAEQTTPAHAAACRDFMERSGGFANAGPFTPFNYKSPDDPQPRSSIQFPGGTGGVNWGGVAADPTTGLIYANAQETSLVGWVQDKPPGETYSFEAVGSTQPYDRASVDGVGPFFSFNAPLSGEYGENGRPVGPTAPCQQPPWGSLVAVNAITGEIAWRSVLGLNENLPEGRQLVGSSGSAGPTVTAGGLVFVGATRDRRLRAFDAANGAELWQVTLDTTANANPMSYSGTSGRQYVAVIAGDMVHAFTLGE